MANNLLSKCICMGMAMAAVGGLAGVITTKILLETKFSGEAGLDRNTMICIILGGCFGVGMILGCLGRYLYETCPTSNAICPNRLANNSAETAKLLSNRALAPTQPVSTVEMTLRQRSYSI